MRGGGELLPFQEYRLLVYVFWWGGEAWVEEEYPWKFSVVEDEMTML